MIDWQRQNCTFEQYGFRDRYMVGGEAILVTVSAKGITRKVVRKWDDKIGALIDPSNDVIPATRLAGSRAARRAARVA